MNKIKIGIIGSGMIVHDLFRFIEEIPEYEFYAIAGTPRSMDQLNELSNEHHIRYVYIDYKELLKNEEVNTVYIATPNHLHYQMCKEALLMGKNVICEKPFTSNGKELKELIEIAKEKHLIMLEAISNQYNRNYLSIKEHIKELGKIKIVQCNYSQYSSRYNAFKQGTILPAFDYQKSGGALMDLNIYNIHFVVGLFGKPERVAYLANIENKIDTSGILTMDYGSFKCVCIGAKDCSSPVTTNVQGDEGCIHLDVPLNVCSAYTLYKNDRSSQEFNYTNGKHRMYDEFVAFAKIIQENDMETSHKMLTHSQIVMDVVDQAKASANLMFAADSGEENK